MAGVCFKCRRQKCFHPTVRRRFKASKKGTTAIAKDQASQKFRRKAKGSKAPLKESRPSSSVPSSSAASFSDLPPELLEKILTHALIQDNPDQYQPDNMLKWFFGYRMVNTIWRDVCDNMIRVADIEGIEQMDYNIEYNQCVPAGLSEEQYWEYRTIKNPWIWKVKNEYLQILLLSLNNEAIYNSNKTVFEYLYGGTKPHAPRFFIYINEICHDCQGDEAKKRVAYSKFLYMMKF